MLVRWLLFFAFWGCSACVMGRLPSFILLRKGFFACCQRHKADKCMGQGRLLGSDREGLLLNAVTARMSWEGKQGACLL